VVPHGQQVDARADCPVGQHVTGGGVTTSGQSLPGEQLLVVNTSFPVQALPGDAVPDDGWAAFVSNGSADEDGEMTVWAICTTTSATST